jgi:hypothetical protein
MAARKEPILFLSRVLYKSVIRGLPLIACDRPAARSAPALRAHTSQREAGKHASLCEAVRSSRSVIYTPEALHFLEAPHIWLASNRTTFSVCAVCMAARKEPILFLSRVLYKSVIRAIYRSTNENQNSLGDSILLFVFPL